MIRKDRSEYVIIKTWFGGFTTTEFAYKCETIMAKNRKPIPEDLAANVIFQSDFTCCVCREREKSVQIHHINEDPSHNV